MKIRYILLAFVIAFVLMAAYLVLLRNSNKTIIFDTENGKVSVNAEVIDTESEREHGLSGRKGLAPNTGMLFVFDKLGIYGIWMMDMRFSIDVLWLDQDKKIIHIENGMSPESYPKVFTSSLQSLYVIELPNQFVATNKVELGDLVAF